MKYQFLKKGEVSPSLRKFANTQTFLRYPLERAVRGGNVKYVPCYFIRVLYEK